MVVEVRFHDVGEGVTEGEVTDFFVRRGEYVKADAPVVEVMTDKVTTELPSPSSGIVKDILVSRGDIVTVGTTILTIETDASDSSSLETKALHQSIPASDFKSGQAKLVPQTGLNDAEKTKKQNVLASPATRKLAREQGVPIDRVTGTGPGGRVTDEDVWLYVKRQTTAFPGRGLAEVEGDDTRRRERAVAAFEEVPFAGRRKQIAKKMVQSMYTIPHVSHFDEADVTELLKWKEAMKRIDPDNEQGFHVSLAAVFIKAVALTLKQFPVFNAQLDEENEVIRLFKDVHIGIAAETEAGLVVPVIRHADQKTIIEINREMKRLIQKAQKNELSADDVKGGTFTVSNVGPLGSTGATPIINYPEVAIMAFHKTRRLPVVNEKDEIQIRSIMNVTLSFDHRVLDGGKAVAFTNAFIQRISRPETMFVEMG